MPHCVNPESVDIVARMGALLFLALRIGYWVLSERRGFRTGRHSVEIVWSRRLAGYLLVVLLAVQLVLPAAILPFPAHPAVQLIGLLLAGVGLLLAVEGRRRLGTNWAHAAEARIKTSHALVDSGLYRWVRHPIYLGMLLSVVGTELAAGSWLAVPLGVGWIVWMHRQAGHEERLLLGRFGASYEAYMVRTRRFLPYVW